MANTKAKLRDTPFILEYLDSRQDAITALQDKVGVNYTFEEQLAIVHFLMELSDEDMAYVIKLAYLLRD